MQYPNHPTPETTWYRLSLRPYEGLPDVEAVMACGSGASEARLAEHAVPKASAIGKPVSIQKEGD